MEGGRNVEEKRLVEVGGANKKKKEGFNTAVFGFKKMKKATLSFQEDIWSCKFCIYSLNISINILTLHVLSISIYWSALTIFYQFQLQPIFHLSSRLKLFYAVLIKAKLG